MKTFAFGLSLAVLLGGCASPVVVTDPTISDKSVRRAAPRVPVCEGRSSPNCRFRNSPVKLEKTPVRLPRRALTFYPTAEPLEFIDVGNRRWVAPAKTLTDGASIPQIFIDIVGNPTSAPFANAAAVHDAYCGVGNEAGPNYHTAPWRAVHRMFYDGLRVGGTPEITAKVMYAAVYIGGPRWDGGGDIPLISTQGPATGPVAARGASRAELSTRQLRQVMREVKGVIETTNPGLGEIEGLADASMSRAALSTSAGAGSDEATGDEGYDPGYDEGNASDPAAGGETDPAAGGE